MESSPRTGSGPTRRPSRLPSLTGLRFIAAALVFADHVRFQWAPGPYPSGFLFSSQSVQGKYSSIFGNAGAVGVAFFFVLSGFVLAWSSRSTDTATAFWRRRIFKIYPNHLVNFAVIMVLFLAVSDLAVDRGHAILNLLLVQSWVPNYDTVFSGNPMAWSLSCEALFYFSFPVLIRYIGRINPQRLWAWAGAVVVAIFLMPTVADAFLPNHVLVPGMTTRTWFIYLFPPVRMLEFVFGILLARIVLTGRRIPLGLGGAMALSIAAYALQWLFPVNYTYVAVMVVPLGLLLVAAATTDAQRRPTLLSRRWMVYLGDISFAFYLWHYPVLTYAGKWLGGHKAGPIPFSAKGYSTPVAFFRMALLFAISLAVAALVYALVERPVYRRFATSRRRPSAPPVLAPADAALPESVPAASGADRAPLTEPGPRT